MLTMNKAKSLACDRICRTSDCPRETVRVIDALTQCRRIGWIFFYESRGPVVVSHRGEVHVLDSTRPANEVLAELESRIVAARRQA